MPWQPRIKKKDLSGLDAVGIKELFAATDPGPLQAVPEAPSPRANLLQTQTH